MGCTPSCDDGIKCIFKALELIDDSGKLDWDKIQETFVGLFVEGKADTAKKVFDDFKNAEQKDQVIGYKLIARFFDAVTTSCPDDLVKEFKGFKCEETCKPKDDSGGSGVGDTGGGNDTGSGSGSGSGGGDGGNGGSDGGTSEP